MMKKILVMALLLSPLFAWAEVRMVVVESTDVSNRTVVASGERYRFESYAIKSQDERYTIRDLAPGRSIVIEIEEGRSTPNRIVQWSMVELL